MATISAERYADWKAPRGDSEVLVWPSPDELVRRTRANHAALCAATSSLIQGVPLPDLRRRMRQFIGHTSDALLVATGHQTELYHPGVFAKNVLIDRVAKAVGGQAYLFAVDTDEPKHLNLRWPGASHPITDDPAITSASWSGQLAPPTPDHLAAIESALESAEHSWDFHPAANDFLHSMRRLSLEAESLSPTLVNALHELDWSLGLRHHALIVSPMFLSEPYLLFAHHVMSRAGDVAADYNAALADYRREQGIKTPGRPMPDLKSSDDQVESPFWLDHLTTGQRSRPTLKKAVGGAGGYTLSPYGAEPFLFSPTTPPEDAASRLLAWLRRHNLRIAPRALTLTTFLRLLLADQFVHGIGGGRYDQVADRFIQKHFAVEPPYFAVTTGTLYFPSAVGRQRVCIPCLLQEGHRLHHAALGAHKLELVDQINSLPRRSLDRRAAFSALHRQLKDLAAPTIAQWEERMRSARQQATEEEALFDRELFYAVQPRDRLEMLIERYDEILGRPNVGR